MLARDVRALLIPPNGHIQCRIPGANRLQQNTSQGTIMGLFSSLRNGIQGPNLAESTARAVLVPPLLVAAADGKIDATEVHQIINMCSYSPIFHAVGAKKMNELADAILADLRSKGAEHCFAQAKSTLTPPLVETAMCFAVRTALADGSIDKSEINTLCTMGERLGMTEQKFTQILEVMVMLQRPAT
jgi:tellurite resistance protein